MDHKINVLLVDDYPLLMLTVSEEGNDLDVSDSTVKVHVQNVQRKLNLHGRVQAAIFAVERRLDKYLIFKKIINQ